MNEVDDAPLSEGQQLMMAYVDDELTPDLRAEFELRMAKDPDLAAEVASYVNLMELTNSITRLEPADHEMRRFWARFYNRSEWHLGWVLLVAGVTVLGLWGLYHLLFAETVHWIVKGAVLSTCAGGILLLVSTVRLKLRTSRFDRYRGVLR